MSRKTFYPTRAFDNAFEGLARLCVLERWTVPTVDLKKLQKDADAQRSERSSHDDLERNYLAAHEAFGLAQAERYREFLAVLSALRGVFRDDKEQLAKLAAFKRPVRRSKKATQPAPAPAPKEPVALVKELPRAA